MQTREWLLTAAVIIVPLIIAVVVTLWSLDQARYRPKKRRSAPVASRDATEVTQSVPSAAEGESR